MNQQTPNREELQYDMANKAYADYNPKPLTNQPIVTPDTSDGGLLELWESMFRNATEARGNGQPTVIHYKDFMERVDRAIHQQRAEARLQEHVEFVLPATESAIAYEQEENGDGILYFDDERARRHAWLAQQSTKDKVEQ